MPGTNSNYLQATNSPLAKLYSSSTLERHHLNQALIILNLDGHRILDSLSPGEYSKILSVIEHAILATDLAVHFSHLGRLNKLAASGSDCLDWESEASVDIVTAALMTAADLGAMTKPWDYQQKVENNCRTNSIAKIENKSSQVLLNDHKYPQALKESCSCSWYYLLHYNNPKTWFCLIWKDNYTFLANQIGNWMYSVLARSLSAKYHVWDCRIESCRLLEWLPRNFGTKATWRSPNCPPHWCLCLTEIWDTNFPSSKSASVRACVYPSTELLVSWTLLWSLWRTQCWTIEISGMNLPSKTMILRRRVKTKWPETYKDWLVRFFASGIPCDI